TITSSSGGASPGSAAPTPSVSPVATATGDGITVTTNVSALLGRALAFTGAAAPTSAGQAIVVQRLDSLSGWVSVASGTVASGGAFSVLWRTNYAGRVTLRTVLERTASASQTGQISPTLQITVYRPAVATYYGTGFFGKRTACGTILRASTLGVASRTLKCGTPVQIYYRGRSIVVPVIDRGPYANHASWDLTQATAQALGMLGTATVGAMPV
ncbi:MAG: septal ring lytic transglycosylase RlpA family protein, partial [Actinomycetota bacterium]|nr:septal ring lytic transglycosylase RlpA family protein [Actinomycetota bacterium]